MIKLIVVLVNDGIVSVVEIMVVVFYELLGILLIGEMIFGKGMV